MYSGLYNSASNIDYNKIAKKLNKLKCPIHRQSASTLIREADGPIFLNCCCLEFEEFLNDEYYNEIDLQMSGDE